MTNTFFNLLITEKSSHTNIRHPVIDNSKIERNKRTKNIRNNG